MGAAADYGFDGVAGAGDHEIEGFGFVIAEVVEDVFDHAALGEILADAAAQPVEIFRAELFYDGVKAVVAAVAAVFAQVQLAGREVVFIADGDDAVSRHAVESRCGEDRLAGAVHICGRENVQDQVSFYAECRLHVFGIHLHDGLVVALRERCGYHPADVVSAVLVFAAGIAQAGYYPVNLLCHDRSFPNKEAHAENFSMSREKFTM